SRTIDVSVALCLAHVNAYPGETALEVLHVIKRRCEDGIALCVYEAPFLADEHRGPAFAERSCLVILRRDGDAAVSIGIPPFVAVLAHRREVLAEAGRTDELGIDYGLLVCIDVSPAIADLDRGA